MKIDNTIKTPSTVSSDSKTRTTRESSSSSASASETKVEISSLSGRLQQLEQAIGQTPVVDSGKVSEIKQAITSGQFKVNPEKVADGLIDSVRQMLAAQPRTA
ncbi:MAG: flagellar biosynthesis anti-sigma factor FlgM [Uliginosibacterium sp.]|jgi:negative regulator of flagellin synthesis FlgM|nr:flagellar biosynthesis anti-sigma factor FlgM [Uliginosibacterium sp.]MBK9392847.1 flagellar biosynthesis anti-sigma factor FlgM [Uliginosibacterium sp.]MBK9614688.1 flagellar biosynthesis anti-sigma factor FlgM [Uliginosibacterium sp.]